MMTSIAARFSFDEKNRGSIETGKLGDFVVLDDDFLTCPPERLRAIRRRSSPSSAAASPSSDGRPPGSD